MTDTRRFAIVPIYADSSGMEIKFPDAIMTGDMSAVMARIKDSKQMRDDLRVSNEADKVRRERVAMRAEFRAERAELDAYADSIAADRAGINEDQVQQLFRMITEFEIRMAKIEHFQPSRGCYQHQSAQGG